MNASSKALRKFVVASYRAGIRKWLSDNNVTQEHLASIAGCDRQYVAYSVSRGSFTRGPTLASAVSIALATGMSLDELCGLDMIRERMTDGQDIR